MTAIPLDAVSVDGFRLGEGLSWRDPEIDCTLVISQPSTDRDLWTEYATGAQRNYRKHGVECTLDVDALRTGADTVMFCVVIDRAGKVVAGVRAKGPLRSAEDSHAVVEWAGQPGQAAVRNMINDRVPFGVVEFKSAWATDDPDRSPGITTAMARIAFPMMAVLDIQFCMATAATYALNRWRSFWRGASRYSRDALPRRTLPNQDDVVEPARFRQICGTRAGCQDPHGDKPTDTRVLPPL